MAYQHGSAPSPTDLLDQLRLFMVAQGWTQSYWAPEGTGYRLHLTKGGWYLNARSSPDSSSVWHASYNTQCPQIGFNLSTGLNTSNVWRDQAGAVRDNGANPIGAGIALPAGAIQQYFFFYDPSSDSLICFVEATLGVWRWVGFGLGMVKQGTWTGGQWLAGATSYYSMSYLASNLPGGNNAVSAYPFAANQSLPVNGNGTPVYVNVDFDSFTGWMSASGVNNTGKIGYTGVPGNANPPTSASGLQNILDRASNTLNSLDVLLPIQVFAERTAGGVSLLGRLPNVYATNPTGLAVGVAYALGADQYVPFPSVTATRGTAVKKV